MQGICQLWRRLRKLSSVALPHLVAAETLFWAQKLTWSWCCSTSTFNSSVSKSRFGNHQESCRVQGGRERVDIAVMKEALFDCIYLLFRSRYQDYGQRYKQTNGHESQFLGINPEFCNSTLRWCWRVHDRDESLVWKQQNPLRSKSTLSLSPSPPPPASMIDCDKQPRHLPVNAPVFHLASAISFPASQSGIKFPENHCQTPEQQNQNPFLRCISRSKSR